MTSQATTMSERIGGALSGEGVRLEQKSATHWAGSVLNGAAHPLEVRWEGDWLLFSGRLTAKGRAATDEELWNALVQNSTGAFEASTTLAANRQLQLRAELLLSDEAEFEVRLRGVLESFQKVWDGEIPPLIAAPEDWAMEIERRCEDAGWSFTRRASGRLTVALETEPVFQAMVTPLGSGVRLEVEAGDFSNHSAICRKAAAVLALEASTHLRMVRATSDEARSRIGFAVCLPVAPLAEELGAGFAGLSAAVTATSEALVALQNENLAGDYLAVRGWTASKQNKKRERTNT